MHVCSFVLCGRLVSPNVWGLNKSHLLPHIISDQPDIPTGAQQSFLFNPQIHQSVEDKVHILTGAAGGGGASVPHLYLLMMNQRMSPRCSVNSATCWTPLQHASIPTGADSFGQWRQAREAKIVSGHVSSTPPCFFLKAEESERRLWWSLWKTLKERSRFTCSFLSLLEPSPYHDRRVIICGWACGHQHYTERAKSDSWVGKPIIHGGKVTIRLICGCSSSLSAINTRSGKYTP